MVAHVVRAVEGAEIAPVVVTIGPHTEAIREALGDRFRYAWQAEALGTGDAVAAGLAEVPESIRRVVVVNGDVPLIEPASIRKLIDRAVETDALVTVLTFETNSPGAYGRLQYTDGRITGIVEAAEDATDYTGAVEINSGVYCFDAAWLREVIQTIPRSKGGEYYLTSVVELAAQDNARPIPIASIKVDPETLIGVDDRARLAIAGKHMRARINARLMASGITLVDPATTYIDADVEIGADTTIEPGCSIRGASRIGEGCLIGPRAVIVDSSLGNGVVVRDSWVESSTIGNGVDVGPYSHLRPDTAVSPDVHIGNYVELKNATIGGRTQIGHFSYLGDATVGERVNIGAGTITCNYDGVRKNHTTIGNDVFIGCDTMLVAPVEVEDRGRTGAGAVVTKTVPAGKTVVGIPARVIGSRHGEKPG